MSEQSGILLESGTNELEVIEFEIHGNRFGINVLKVKEIIVPVEYTSIPHAHPYVLGIIQLRGEVLPVISLEKALGLPTTGSKDPSKEKYIVAEFNRQKVVFHVHQVTKIHRISWDKIEKPAELYTFDSSLVIGVIKEAEQMILLLDFEKVLVEINPDAGINVSQIKSLGKRERTKKQLLVVEDSPLLRKLLNETLNEAGYENLTFYDNGKDALAYIENIIDEGKNVYDEVNLIITDIEMPQMDGHHFTKRVKEHPQSTQLPVIIFSSLITGDLLYKGELVGAVAQISKPEIKELVLQIDQHVL